MRLNDLTIKSLKTGVRRSVWCDDLPCFGVRISQRSKTFVTKQNNRYHVIGKYPVVTLKQAREAAKQLLGQRYGLTSSISTSEAVKLFLAQKQDLRPATQRLYSLYVSQLPDVPLVSLTAREVYDVLPEGKAAQNLAFKSIKAFLNWCVERDYLSENPIKSRKQPNKLKPRDRLLSDDEFKAIWKLSHKYGSHGSLWQLLLLTGQRYGQFLNLQPEWILDDRITWPAEAMKGATVHSIPLTINVQTILNRHPPPYTSTTNLLEQFRTQLNLPHFTQHDFRRFFSSTMGAIGTPIHITEIILDHKSGSRNLIQRTYDRHGYFEECRTALKNYEQRLLQIVQA